MKVSTPFNKDVASELLKNEDAFAFCLITILLQKYGDDLFDMEPVILFKEIEEDFNIKLPEENECKISAALTLLTTNAFYENVNVFKATVLAFTEGDVGGIADGDDEDIDCLAALWTVFEAGLFADQDVADMEDNFASSISKLIIDSIEEVAEDIESISDDVDTLEEAINTPYFIRHLKVNAIELAEQLIKLGVAEDMVKDRILDSSIFTH